MKIFALNIEQLKENEIYNRAYDIADEVRKRKASSYKRKGERAQSLGAGLLLAYMVSKELNCPWRMLKNTFSMQYGMREKPFFTEYKGIAFNLSHSGSYAVCAMSVGKSCYEPDRANEVGIDIQKLHDCHLPTARRAFRENEYQYLKKLVEIDEKKAACEFTGMWADRESIGKLLGTGIFQTEQMKGNVFLRRYEIQNEYMISAASGQDCFPKEISYVELEEILEFLSS